MIIAMISKQEVKTNMRNRNQDHEAEKPDRKGQEQLLSPKLSRQRNIALRLAAGMAMILFGVFIAVLFVNRPEYEQINHILIAAFLMCWLGGSGVIVFGVIGLVGGCLIAAIAAMMITMSRTKLGIVFLLCTASLSGYIALSDWKALPQAKRTAKRRAVACCNAIGLFLGLQVLISPVPELKDMWVGLAIFFVAATCGYVLKNPELLPERKKIKSEMTKKLYFPQDIMILALVFRLIRNYRFELESIGKILLYAAALAVLLFAFVWRISFRRNTKNLGMDKRLVLWIALYAVALVGFGNTMLPQKEPKQILCVVEELRRGRTGRGNKTYYADVLGEGEQFTFQIGYLDYRELDIGDELRISRYDGAFGIPYDRLSYK